MASSDDISFESDDAKKVKVAAAAATGGLIFYFGPSTVRKGCIRVMEGLGYFAKGEA
jgi:hypothetical protein